MRNYPSPFMTCMVITGIILVGVAAPVAIFVFIAAALIQRSHNNKGRAAYRAAYAKAVAKQEREKSAALRYFAS